MVFIHTSYEPSAKSVSYGPKFFFVFFFSFLWPEYEAWIKLGSVICGTVRATSLIRCLLGDKPLVLTRSEEVLLAINMQPSFTVKHFKY